MSHFAKVVDGIVTQVIVAEQDFIDTQEGTWIQTSYNTRGNIHYESNSNTQSADQTKALRGNFAGINDIYDADNDVFYNPQPYNSWTLNTNTWLWEAPVSYPTDNKYYIWNENQLNWELVNTNGGE